MRPYTSYLAVLSRATDEESLAVRYLRIAKKILSEPCISIQQVARPYPGATCHKLNTVHAYSTVNATSYQLPATSYQLPATSYRLASHGWRRGACGHVAFGNLGDAMTVAF